MNRIAVIFGVKGYKLTNKEKQLFKKTKPWGIILFSRNIKNLSQLKILTNDIKKILRDKNYPILIDQEGGKVSRLNKIIDLSLFSQYSFGKLYNKNKKLFYIIYKIYIDKVCGIFKKFFSISCDYWGVVMAIMFCHPVARNVFNYSCNSIFFI